MGVSRVFGLLALVTLCGLSIADHDRDRPIGFLNNIGDASSYSTFEFLYDTYADESVKAILNGTDVGGVFLVPNNEAFTSVLDFLKIDADDLIGSFVNAVLMDHIIQDHPVTGMDENKNFSTKTGTDVLVEVTFDENGEITHAKAQDSPLGFLGVGKVVGMYNTSAPGNATIYFVDTVVLTQATFDKYIDDAAPNFYAALLKLKAEEAKVSSIMDLLDTDDFSDLKNLLMDTPNGTFFVPNDAAAAAFLNAFNITEASDLTETEGLKKMTEAILLHHMVPDEILDSNTNLPATATSALKNLGVEASNLKFVEDDNGPVILHRNPLGDSTTNASIVGADAKMTTSNGYKLGQGGSEYRGRLHIIDKVMLPIPEAGVPTLKDWMDSTPQGETYNIFKQVLDLVPDAKPAITGPVLQGVIFMPSDAAFDKFLSSPTINGTGLTLDILEANPSIVQEILAGHIIWDTVITGNGTYMTVMGEANVTVTLDSEGLVSSFERASGVIDGFQDVPTVASIEGYTPQNANGHVAMITGGAAANGRIFFVDQVIVSQALVEKVAKQASPAGGKWQKELESLAGNPTFNEAVELINLEGLESIKSLIDGKEDFTMFMPNDKALAGLAEQYGLTTEDFKSKIRRDPSLARNMLETYIVMGDVNEGTGGEYQTENENFLTVEVEQGKGVTGITVSDKENGSTRKLFSADKGGVSGKAAFLNGQTMFSLDDAPLTAEQQNIFKAALENSAGTTSPSFLLLAATLAVFTALLSL